VPCMASSWTAPLVVKVVENDDEGVSGATEDKTGQENGGKRLAPP
jgi:hypothetical protein